MLLRLRKGILALAMGPDGSAFVDCDLDYKTGFHVHFLQWDRMHLYGNQTLGLVSLNAFSDNRKYQEVTIQS